MDIEIKEKCSKNFYREFTNIYYSYNMLKKNSKIKIKDQFLSVIKCLIITILLLIIIIVLDINEHILAYSIFKCCLGIIIILEIIIFNIINRFVNNLSNNNGKIIFSINKNGVSYKIKEIEYSINWDDLLYIVIKKDVIAFLGNDSKVLIGIPNKYYENICDYIVKYKQEDKILYK